MVKTKVEIQESVGVGLGCRCKYVCVHVCICVCVHVRVHACVLFGQSLAFGKSISIILKIVWQFQLEFIVNEKLRHTESIELQSGHSIYYVFSLKSLIIPFEISTILPIRPSILIWLFSFFLYNMIYFPFVPFLLPPFFWSLLPGSFHWHISLDLTYILILVTSLKPH